MEKNSKKIISNYETDLINAKILKDSSGNSYVELLKKIQSNKNFENDWPEPFLERFMQSGELVKADMENVKNCSEKIDSIEKIILDLNNSNNSVIAKRIVSNLSEDDFEKDFYKFRVLMIIDEIKPTSENSNFDEQLPLSTDSLDVYLDGENKSYIEGKIIKIENVNEIASEYFNDLTSKNNLSFSSSKTAMYKNYTDLVDEITRAFIDSRNIFSVNLYGTEYESLKAHNKKKVDESFPKYFIE